MIIGARYWNNGEIVQNPCQGHDEEGIEPDEEINVFTDGKEFYVECPRCGAIYMEVDSDWQYHQAQFKVVGTQTTYNYNYNG